MLTSSTETLTTAEAATAGALMGGMLGTVVVASIAIAIIMIIASWKIFTKAGEKGWKSLIPIYNVYILFKISGFKSGFWTLVCVEIAAFLVTFIAVAAGQATVTDGQITEFSNPIYPILLFCAAGIEIVIGIMAYYKLAKAFKRGIGTTIGLIFLPFIFTLILAFGSAKYDKKVLKK
ncbi:hypothetical protein IJU22_00730 [Candidatus Saccharibacteria bacterium]|nr:hypothetical protein [Candidatus Saccharibacteria bacterium]